MKGKKVRNTNRISKIKEGDEATARQVTMVSLEDQINKLKVQRHDMMMLAEQNQQNLARSYQQLARFTQQREALVKQKIEVPVKGGGNGAK